VPVDATALATARDSGLLRLLATPQRESESDRDELRGRGRFWVWLNRGYVAAVLLLAAAACVLWLLIDPSRALEVTTAVLVVTCPCAFGLAMPLAFELAVARLRRFGIYVRATTLLEKARHVRKVVFDKTGTLTWGGLDAHPLRRVQPGIAMDVLFTMASSSNHPVSRAIAQQLAAGGHAFLADLVVEESPGQGLASTRKSVSYKLGAPPFALGDGRDDLGNDVCVFTRDGHVEACFHLEEDVRGGFQREIAELQAAGYEVYLLSGDRERDRENKLPLCGSEGTPRLEGVGRKVRYRRVWSAPSRVKDLVCGGLRRTSPCGESICPHRKGRALSRRAEPGRAGGVPGRWGAARPGGRGARGCVVWRVAR
jgi:Cu2+-exporting ATPase